MFEQVFENLQKATESSVKLQQEMFQKWVEAFPAAPTVSTATNGVAQVRQKWEEATTAMLRKQRELVDQNYEAGIKALHDIFTVADAKSPQEFQQKVTELYRKSFESLRKISESQMSEFKSAVEKWAELFTSSVAR